MTDEEINESLISKLKDLNKYINKLPGKYLTALKSPIKIVKRFNAKSLRDSVIINKRINDFAKKHNYTVVINEYDILVKLTQISLELYEISDKKFMANNILIDRSGSNWIVTNFFSVSDEDYGLSSMKFDVPNNKLIEVLESYYQDYIDTKDYAKEEE